MTRIVEGGAEPRQWQEVHTDLTPFSSQTKELRLYQLVLVADCLPGIAYWKSIRVE